MAFKNQLCKEQQEKRFEQERTILVKNYENELQSMIDQQKKQVEKAEEQQHVDLKVIFNSECKKVPFWQFFRKADMAFFNPCIKIIFGGAKCIQSFEVVNNSPL